MLSDNTVKGEIAYGVIAGLMWVIWVAVAVWGHLRSAGTSGETGENAFGQSTSGERGEKALGQVESGQSDEGSSPDRYKA